MLPSVLVKKSFTNVVTIVILVKPLLHVCVCLVMLLLSELVSQIVNVLMDIMKIPPVPVFNVKHNAKLVNLKLYVTLVPVTESMPQLVTVQSILTVF